MASRILVGICCFFLAVSGCSHFLKSRYAMDDPVYAAKYAEGAEKTEPLKKLKQAVDARHTEGLEGGYFGGGSQWRNTSQNMLASAEIGGEVYPVSWYSQRAALSGYVGHGDWFAGADVGARLQLPTRLTPFVGIGTMHGFSTTYVLADDDGIDNDDDEIIDERGEEDLSFDGWLSAVYPEVGVHFWATGQSRVSLFGRYLVTSEGRDYDDWLAGLQFSIFDR